MKAFFAKIHTVGLLSGFLVMNAGSAWAEPEHILDKNSVYDAPIPHTPWTLEEVCQASGGKYCNPNEVISHVAANGTKLFEGKVSEYVRFLEEQEIGLNKVGQTLRGEGDIRAGKIPTDPKKLKEALLEALKANGPGVLQKIMSGKAPENCEMLPDPGHNIEGPGRQYTISLPDGGRLNVNQLISRINDQQKILCSLGYSIFDLVPMNMGQDPRILIKQLINARDQLLKDLGLDQYAAYFNLEEFNQVAKYLDVAKDIQALLEAKKFPSPEQIFALQNKLNNILPEDMQIPELPSIPTPSPPDFSYLDLKKVKEWNGLNMGERSRIAAEAKAKFELRGNRSEQAAIATGNASVYILNREISMLGGYAYFHAAPTVIEGKMELKALGQDIFEPQEFKEEMEYTFGDPALFHWDFDKGYTQQFMIGPVPVYVSLGARAGINLGYEVGIAFMRLSGALVPSGFAQGYAQAAAGIKGILSVGAEANIVIIQIEAPLRGRALILFDDDGAPYLDMEITSDVNHTTLKGGVYAYAEYPKPRVGIPPWKIKKATKEIFGFEGNTASHRIMNWGMIVGRKGTKLKGDLLDQTDRKEAEAFAAKVKFQERAEEAKKYKKAYADKAALIFSGIKADFEGPSHAGVAPKVEQIRQLKTQFDQNIGKFNKDLQSSAEI